MKWGSIVFHRLCLRNACIFPTRRFLSTSNHKMKAVVVLGTTGSGKSRLAIDIALKYNGEVVNADAIQMYRGLDRVSAKVTEDEKQGIPHHLMSFLSPMESFTVRDYYHIANNVIKDITSRGKLPVIVGGTMYYIQSLLRPSLLEEDENRLSVANKRQSDESLSDNERMVVRDAVVTETDVTESPHELLRKVDPIMANRLHPNDTRKISRALEVYNTTGVPYSTVLQKQAERLRSASGGLDACIFWLQVRDSAVLNKRLDDRVTAMVDTGLEKEIQSLYQYIQSHEASISETDASLLPLSTNASTVRSSNGDSGFFCKDMAVSDLSTLDEPTPLTLRVVKEYRQRNDPSVDTASSINSSTSTAPEPQNEDQKSYQGLLQAIGYKEFEKYLHEWSSLGCPPITQIRHLVRDLVISNVPKEDIVANWVKYKQKSNKKSYPNTPSSYTHVYGTVTGKRARDVAGEETNTVDDDASTSSHGSTVDSAMDSSTMQMFQDIEWLVKVTGDKGVCDYVLPSGEKVNLTNLYQHFESGVEKLQRITHLYARKQDRWIRNRFAARGISMFPLDTSLSDPASDWDKDVRDHASKAMAEWYNCTSAGIVVTTDSATGSPASQGFASNIEAQPEISRILEWKQFTCDVCNGKVLNGQRSWDDHLRSKKHRRNATIRKNMEEMGMTYVEGMCLKEYYRKLNELKSKRHK